MDTDTFPDERLELVFTCCHPALAIDAQVALTLRTLGGLTHRGDRPRVPRRRADDGPAAGAGQAQDQGRGDPVPRPARRTCCPIGCAAVLAVVYLIFNEGYGGRGELAAEAIRLGGALAELMPDEPEVHGLLAMMLLHDSRRAAPVSRRRARAARRPGPLAVGRRADRGTAARRSSARWRCTGAAPTSCRPRSPRCTLEEQSDWPQIAALYGELAQADRTRRSSSSTARRDSPHAQGWQEGLRAIDRLEGLEDYHYYHAARADLLRRLERSEEARVAYERALELAREEPERRFLIGRIAEL